MDEQSNIQAPDNRYERMCIALYLYRSGAMDFLQLLDKLEAIIADRPQPPLEKPQNTTTN